MSLVIVAALATVAHAKPACRKQQRHERASFSAGDHVVRACFERPSKCYVLALELGVPQWRADRAVPKPAPEPELQIHAVAKVCSDGTCHSYATPDEPFVAISTYRSADAIVAVFDGAIVVFDAATGAERGRSTAGFNVHDVRFFADRFVVFDQETTRMHDLATGKQIIDFGKPMGPSLDLGDGTIALSSHGRLDAFDRAGKLVHAVQTGADPTFLVQSRDQRTLALDGARDAVQVVELATWTMKAAPAPFCP